MQGEYEENGCQKLEERIKANKEHINKEINVQEEISIRK